MSVDIHLRGAKVGSLSRQAGGYVFAYDVDVIERLGDDRARLSMSLQPRAEPFDPAETRAWVEGLLPQGPRRRKLAHDLGLDPADGYGLIAELGRDCPGAVTFLPRDARSEAGTAKEPAWLGEEELAAALEDPPDLSFDPACPQRMRFALPGERHKLALVRDERRDRWAWPEEGAPSTHVIIPESRLHPEFVLNEYVCSTSLRSLGMPVPYSRIEIVADRPCLVARRFDRWGEGGDAERLHSESFDQALGIAPDADVNPVPRLVWSAQLLLSIGEEQFRESFFSVAFCAWAFGSSDERYTQNVTLLHGEAGPLPGMFCDIASHQVYEPADLKTPLFEAAERCSAIVAAGKLGVGLLLDPERSTRLAVRHLFGLTELLEAVSGKAADEGWHGPVIDRIQEQTARRLEFLREEISGA